jgi:thiamine biosynthesis lipoprotein
MTVEEGGFGKGAGLRTAVAAARAAGADCVRVDLGGQWAGDGSCAPVPMSIAHPADRGTPVATFDWTAGSVATSGHSERRVTADGIAFSHLLDPRTGWPAEDRGSVTVLAADPLAADAVATALAVMGAEEGLRWLEGHREFEAVFATTDSRGVVRLAATPGVGGRIRPLDGVLVEVVAHGRVAARGASGGCRGSQGAMR